ncbi:MAG TPA: efflux RND transporter periplasmic adaptor subunit, partial [Candidatus Limnocylindrales bacterium]|nr:efflux RND transporter periplasmic adaptor subunit [Candidatus Limnocylindrales bacterium]
ANLKTAKANVEKAQVAVKDAAQNLQRRLELFKAALISASDRDTAQTAYDSAVAQLKAAEAQRDAVEAQLKSAKAQYNSALARREMALAGIKQAEAALEQAKVNLEHTTIRSPIDGIVISRSVDVGQTVAASLQAPTLFTIAQDLTRMQVNASIDETDIGKVRVGQEVIFTVSAYPGESFSGKVTQIRNQPITTQNVVTYDTIIEVDNPELKLKPGMTATVSIITAKREGVKRVLNAALNFKPASIEARQPVALPKGTRRVWILSNGSDPRPVSVEVGLTDGTYTEIKGDSLQEGQEVITGIKEAKTDSQQSSRPPGFGRFF